MQTKEVNKKHKSNDRQYNGQKKKDNKDQQKYIHKTPYRKPKIK